MTQHDQEIASKIEAAVASIANEHEITNDEAREIAARSLGLVTEQQHEEVVDLAVKHANDYLDLFNLLADLVSALEHTGMMQSGRAQGKNALARAFMAARTRVTRTHRSED